MPFLSSTTQKTDITVETQELNLSIDFEEDDVREPQGIYLGYIDSPMELILVEIKD